PDGREFNFIWKGKNERSFKHVIQYRMRHGRFGRRFWPRAAFLAATACKFPCLATSSSSLGTDARSEPAVDGFSVLDTVGSCIPEGRRLRHHGRRRGKPFSNSCGDRLSNSSRLAPASLHCPHTLIVHLDWP